MQVNSGLPVDTGGSLESFDLFWGEGLDNPAWTGLLYLSAKCNHFY